MITYIETPEILITDRHIATVSKITPETSITFNSINTKFVMLTSGAIVFSNSDSISGCISAAINDIFTVSGHGLVVSVPGLRLAEESITRCDPGKSGNLSYIDGCSNSNLVHPARNGDPCLNYLYFPPGITQTFHTHPSYRIGLILSGSGIADTDTDQYALTTGKMFLLSRHSVHRFITTDSHMSLMVFHPDSEDGPRDEFNPMKSRTYIQK
jgi:quercetin dioxygenase-like cupin family protein